MLYFSDVLTEDRNFIERNGAIYGYDRNGKEYEITPEMINRYFDKYGGRWKPFAWGMGSALAGGLASVPVGLGTGMTMNALGASPTASSIGMSAVQGGLVGGSAGLGLVHGIRNVYDDIARKRLSGEFK